MAVDKTIYLSGEQAYDLMLAALDLVSDVSPAVHKRLRSPLAPRPLVRPEHLLALVDVLNGIRPGLADRVITDTDAQRRAARARVRGVKAK